MVNRYDARLRRSVFARLMFIAGLAFGAASSCAQDADAIRQYQFEPASSGYQIVMKQVPRPVAGDNDVLVRIRAVSLNRRDLNMLHNDYGDDFSYAGSIPLSDGAGEVIAVGKNVTRFKMGIALQVSSSKSGSTARRVRKHCCRTAAAMPVACFQKSS